MHRVLLPFEFSEPASVAEAVALVDGDRARALAGGVDLVLKMRLRQIVPEQVVSLQKMPGLDYVRVGRRRPRGHAGALRIGALATLRQVETLAGGAAELAAAGRGHRLHRLGADQGDGHRGGQPLRRHAGVRRGAGPVCAWGPA